MDPNLETKRSGESGARTISAGPSNSFGLGVVLCGGLGFRGLGFRVIRGCKVYVRIISGYLGLRRDGGGDGRGIGLSSSSLYDLKGEAYPLNNLFMDLKF